MRLILKMLAEILLGVTVAGVLLAIALPILIHSNVLQPGETLGGILVCGSIASAILLMLLRPGSAVQRHLRK
jgi:hypothetical protein